MSRKRYKPEQIIGKLREAEVALAQGETTGQVCRTLGIAEQTFYRRRREYGGLKIEQARRLKVLEQENTRLRRPVPTPQLRSWAIRIMESPMFCKGGLRGKKLPVAGKIEYKSIPIQDLESLVMLLASDLDRHATGKLGRVAFKAPYDRVLKDFDEIISLAMVASDYLLKKRILTARKKLYELREKIPPFFREPDIIYLVDLRLYTFVADAKVSETSRATELLLAHLGLPVKRETARRRRYREKARDD